MSIHIIPTIYEPTGEVATDADGFDYPLTQKVEGFHVNTIDETIEGAEQHLLPTPSTPYNLYAGREVSEHNFYCFPDEATFRQFVPEPQELEDETT